MPLKRLITPVRGQAWMPVPNLQPMQRMVIDAYEKAVEKDIHVRSGATAKSTLAPRSQRTARPLSGICVSTKGARISVKDLTLLQGFDADDVDWAGAGVTANQFAVCLGNAQSLNVVVAVLPHLLYKAKLADHQEAVQLDEALTRH
jgi:hypothetical protein